MGVCCKGVCFCASKTLLIQLEFFYLGGSFWCSVRYVVGRREAGWWELVSGSWLMGGGESSKKILRERFLSRRYFTQKNIKFWNNFTTMIRILLKT